MVRVEIIIFVMEAALLTLPKKSLIFGYFEEEVYDPAFGKCERDSRDLGACIHKYLEKDFIAISPIVYPKKTSSSHCSNRRAFGRSHHVMMDGPTLQNSCNDLHHVYQCMFDELYHCRSLDNFFQLRHLLYALREIVHWLCGPQINGDDIAISDENDHSKLRSRFLGLLESIECIECTRTLHYDCTAKGDESKLGSAVDHVSLWHNILRFNIGLEVCGELRRKMNCLQKDELLERNCGRPASEIHKNLTRILLSNWCDNAPFTLSNAYKGRTNFLTHFLLCIFLLIMLN